MNSRERILKILKGEKVDRIGKVEAPWPHTRERWHNEGIPRNVHANDYFQMDFRKMIKIDSSLMLKGDIREKSDQFIIGLDRNGVLVKGWKDQHASPLPLEYSVRSNNDWKRLKEHLVPSPDRFSFGYYGDYGYEYDEIPLKNLKAAIDSAENMRDTCLTIQFPEPYEATMARVGDEQLLMWMANEPELVNDMFEAHADFMNKCVDMLFDAGVKPDCAWLGGDIAYKNGMLFSPRMYKKLLQPHHKTMISHYHKLGLPVIYHSDGLITDALPLLIDAGIDCIQPLERQTGLDVAELAKQYKDKVSFMGNLSVIELSKTKDAAVAEARRCIRGGKTSRGYCLHSDHSMPPTVSLENFKAVMEVFDAEAAF